MIRRAGLLCVLAGLLLCTAAFAGRGDVPLTDGRSRYTMDVTLDTDAARISGTVSVAFENDSDVPWEQILFCDYVPAVQEHVQPGAYSSAITSVTDGAGTALDFVSSREDGLVTVTLPVPLAPGDTADLVIGFEADVPRAEGERFQAASFPGSDGTTFRLCQFYPMLCVWRDGGFVHHPYEFCGEAFFTECSDYSMTLRLPETYTVIASGTETCTGTEDGLAVWQIEAESMRDLVITATTEFDPPRTGLVNGVTVRSWGTPDHLLQTRLSLQVAMEAIQVFEEKIGPFPYSELDVCAAYMPEAAGGIEYPGLIEILQITDEDAALYGGLEAAMQVIVSHEVAHQWFYAAVGNDQYDEPFLDESFASYLELTYRQYALGESRDSIAEQMRDISDYVDSCGPDFALEADQSLDDYKRIGGDDYSNTYSLAVYQCGRTFLWDVQQVMGDEAFFQMLRSWYDTWQFRTATVDQFLDHLTAASGGDAAVTALIEKYMTA